MGKPKRTTNSRVSYPTPGKELFKKTKSKIMKTKGKKLLIRNKKKKMNINDNDNMTNTAFKEEVFGKLDFLEMEQNIEDIKM
tara:strand:+ start:415 stop:660 length:246 start_codon:yes stop_codon:yes gene_type:complete